MKCQFGERFGEMFGESKSERLGERFGRRFDIWVIGVRASVRALEVSDIE